MAKRINGKGKRKLKAAEEQTYFKNREQIQDALNQAIKAGNLTAFNVAIAQGAKIDGIKVFHTASSAQYTEKQLAENAEQQYRDVERILSEQLSQIEIEEIELETTANELLEINLLVQDTALSGMLLPDSYTMEQRVISALLQKVYHYYPIFSLANINNEFMPENWPIYIDNIIEKANIKLTNTINIATLQSIVDAINTEYAINEISIAATVETDNNIIEYGDKHANHCRLILNEGHCLILVPSEQCYTPKEQAAELIKNLQLQGGVLQQYILDRIAAKLANDIHAVSYDALQQLIKDEQALFNKVNSFTQLLDEQQLTAEPTLVNSAFILIKKLALFESQKIFTPVEIKTKFGQFQQAYLELLIANIQREYLRRRDNIQQLMEDDPIKRLKKRLQHKEGEINSTIQSIAEKVQALDQEEAALVELKLKAEQLDVSYQQQQQEVGAKLAKLQAEAVLNKEELAKFESQYNASVENYKAAQDKQIENLALQKALRIKQKELTQQRNKVHNELNLLQHKLEEFKAEKDKFEIGKEHASKLKIEAEGKLQTLQVLSSFLKQTQETIAASDTLFKQKRQEIRENIQKFRTNGKNQFLELYTYLTAIPELAHLKSAEVEAEAANAELFFTECLDAIEEVLTGVSAIFDYTTGTLNCKSFNVSWQESYDELLIFVKQKLLTFGIECNASGHLIVPHYVPRLKDLPNKLYELISERYKAITQPDKLSGPEDNAAWSRLNDPKQAKNIIESLNIHLDDVMFCFVNAIDLIAGNNIFVESNILLKGMDLTLFANANIYFPPNCKMITTALDAPQFVATKARNADEYHEVSRAGDNGLSGFAGNSAGHIFINANKQISNLDTLYCEANGGNGAPGQIGGNGAQGCDGGDTPDGEPGDCPGNFLGIFGSSHMIVAEARIPGVGADQKRIKGEVSGFGGNGGKAGWGGEGGFKGDIVIESFQNTIYLVNNQPETISGPNIDENIKSRMISKKGNSGKDGLQISKGGKAGKAGYLGKTTVKRKKRRMVFIFPKWETESSTNYYDLGEYKEAVEAMRNMSGGVVGFLNNHGGFKDFKQSDYGDGYSHKYETKWYTDDFIKADKITYQSQDKRSRGEDKSHDQNFGMVAKGKRQIAEKKHNRILQANYKTSLQQEAQKTAKLVAVTKSQERTEKEINKLTKEIADLTNKIAVCNDGINKKSAQIEQTNSIINEKTVDFNQLEQKLTDINQQIAIAEHEGADISAQLLKAIESLAQIADAMQKANLKLETTKIDIQAEHNVQQKLESLRTQLQQSILHAKNESINHIQNHKVVQQELLEIKAIQEQELAQLKEEYERQVAEQERYRQEAEELTNYLALTSNIAQDAVLTSENVTVSIDVGHDEIEQKISDELKIFIEDNRENLPEDRYFTIHELNDKLQAEYSHLIGNKHELLSSPIMQLHALTQMDFAEYNEQLYLCQSAYHGMPIQRVYKKIKEFMLINPAIETQLLSAQGRRVQHVNNFFTLLTKWVLQVRGLSREDLIFLWDGLHKIGDKIASAHQDIQSVVYPLYKTLCFTVQEKSTECLYLAIDKAEMAEEEIASIKPRVDEILYSDKQIDDSEYISTIRFRKNFYQFFFSDTLKDGLKALFTLSQWSLAYSYKKIEEPVLLEQLKAIAQGLKCSELDNMADIDALYFAICNQLIHCKIIRLIAKAEEESIPLAGVKHYKDIIEIFIRFKQLFAENTAETHIICRLYNMLQQEVMGLLYDSVLPKLANAKCSPQKLIDTLYKLYDDALLSDIDAYQLIRDTLSSLGKNSIEWSQILIEFLKRKEQVSVHDLELAIWEKIDIFQLDADDYSIDSALKFINDIALCQNQEPKILLEDIMRQVFTKWAKLVEQIKINIGNDAEWIRTNSPLQLLMNTLSCNCKDLPVEYQLQRLKIVNSRLSKYKSTNDISAFLTGIQQLQAELILQARQDLLDLLKSSILEQVDINHDKFYTILLAKASDENCIEFLEKFLFCLRIDSHAKNNLSELECLVNLQKNNALASEDFRLSKIKLDYLNKIDDFIDNVYISNITQQITICRTACDNASQSINDITSEIKKFENFYSQKNATNMQDEENKKLLLRLLLVKAKTNDIDVKEAENIDELIKKVNEGLCCKLIEDKLITPKKKYKNAKEYKELWNKLVNKIKNKASVDEIFKHWLPILQKMVESVQANKIKLWHSDFIINSIVILQNIFFNSIDLQKEMYVFAQQLQQALANLCLPTSDGQYNDEIYQIEQFAKRLMASAYKCDLYRNIDLLIDDFEKTNTKHQRYAVLETLEHEALPRIKLLFEAMRLSANSSKTRSQLTGEIIRKLSSNALLQRPTACIEHIEKLLVQMNSDLVDKPFASADELQILLQKALNSSDSVFIRDAYSRVFLWLLCNKLSFDEFNDFIKVFISHHKACGKKHRLFLASIFMAITRKYLDDILSKCQQDDSFIQWAPAFARFIPLIDDFSIEVLVLLTHLSLGIKTQSLDAALFQALQTIGVNKKLDQAFNSLIVKAQNAQGLAGKDIKKFALLSSLLPFYSAKSAIIEHNVARVVKKFNKDKEYSRQYKDIIISLLAEACQLYVDEKFSEANIINKLKQFILSLSKQASQADIDSERAFEFLFTVHILLQNHQPREGLERQFIEVLLNDPSKHQFIFNGLLTPTEQLYAKRIDVKYLPKVLLDNFNSDYLKPVKQAYWQQHICMQLFGKFLSNFFKLKEFMHLPFYKERLEEFVFTENYSAMQKHYQALSLLVGGLEKTNNQRDFINEIKQVYEFKKYLVVTHSVAVAEHAEANWVQLIDGLLQHYHQGITISTLAKILNLAAYFKNTSILTELVLASQSTDMLQNILIYLLKLGVEKQVTDAAKIESAVLKKLTDKVFSTPTGLCFLEVLAKALYAGNGKGTKLFSMHAFQQLMQSLFSIESYADRRLINELELHPIQYWPSILKRKQLTVKLHLKLQDKTHNRLLENLITLQKTENLKLLEQFLDLISANSNINYEILDKIFKKFASRDWSLDKNTRKIIENKPEEKWYESLALHFNSDISNEVVKHDIHQLATEMRKAGGKINNSIADLLYAGTKLTNGQVLSLEEIIVVINKRYNELAEAQKNMGAQEKKQEIINKVNTKFNINKRADKDSPMFLRNGNIEEMIEFLALSKLAVQLAEGKIIYDSQLIALVCFISGFDKKQGRLANVSTGEGKSLITRLLAIACALRGEIVDVVTSSRALAEPNAEEAKPLFEYFDLKVDNICDPKAEKDEIERTKRYTSNNVLFGDVSSFQRDLLLTEFFGKSIRPSHSNRLIVDEADSMFIDNISQVLFISHTIGDLAHLRSILEFIWQCVYAKDTQTYSERNVKNIAKLFHKELTGGTLKIPPHLSEFVENRLNTWIRNAYLAKNLDADKEYSIIAKGEYTDKAIINDLPTGVEQFQAQWSNGLHQFVQLKHRKALTNETLRAIFVSNVSYFSRYSETGRLNGMTGTLGAENERDLLEKIYGVEFFAVPRFAKDKFRYKRGRVVGDIDDWHKAILQEVENKISCDKPAKNYDIDKFQNELNQLLVQESNLVVKIQQYENEQKQYPKQVHEIEKELVEIECQIPYISSHDIEGKTKTVEQIKLDRQAKIQERDNKEKKLINVKKQSEELDNTINDLYQDRNNVRVKRENIESILSGKSSQAVLIICRDKDSAKKIHAHLQKELQNALTNKQANLYLYNSYLDKLELKTAQAQPGDIVVATNIAGRGTDIEISEHLAQQGGLHVVLSYIPSNIRIEEQAFRRAARKGLPGSGKYIVYDERARDNFPVSIELLRDERDELERLRLDEIRQIKIPRLRMEQNLSEVFCELQVDIKQRLDDRKIAKEIVKLQLKSLQNAWAFWFDAHDEMMENTYKLDKKVILNTFEKFKSQVYSKLNASQEMLITEPAELLALAKCHMKMKNYSDAIRCFNKIIELDPVFSGFAYYYLAQAIICTGSFSENKRKARAALKNAIPLFEEQVARLSTANQIIMAISEKMQNSGTGLSADLFTKTNVDEMSVYQVHIQAAKDAVGSELSPSSFKTGEVSESESKLLFENFHKANIKQIKGYRISRKLTVQDDPVTGELELFYNDTKATFPTELNYCKAAVIEFLRGKVGNMSYKKRQVNLKDFDKFTLTSEKLLEILNGHVNKTQLVMACTGIEQKCLGTSIWKAHEFLGHGEKIKAVILAIRGYVTKKELIEKLKQEIGTEHLDGDAICNKLQSYELIKYNDGYVFTQESRDILQKNLEKIVLNKHVDLAAGITNMPLEKIPEFREHAENIRKVINHAIKLGNQNPITINDFQAAGLNFSKELFNKLVLTLRGFGLLDNHLQQALNINVDPSYWQRSVEDTLYITLQTGVFKEDELGLPAKAEEGTALLWHQLIVNKIARNPTVYFPNITDSELQVKQDFKAIRKQIKAKMNELIAGIGKLDKEPKPADDIKRLRDAIFEVLEKSVGTLRSIHKVKLENRDIAKFFNEKNLPPIVVEHMNSAMQDVLNLVVDKDTGFWDWDAFLCAMIGVAQIIAGAIITFCCPAAAYLGQILINEGLSDITFAVTSAINGNFSWKAYGNHKLQSLAVSLLSAGVGAALSSGATVANQGLNLSGAVLKELGNAAVQTITDVAINYVMSNISENLISSIFDSFKHELKSKVRSNTAPVRTLLKQNFAQLYTLLSAADANLAIQRILHEADIQKIINGDVSVKAFRAIEAVSTKLAGLKKSAAKGSLLETIGNIASEVSSFLSNIYGYVKASNDIILTPAQILMQIHALLKNKINRFEQQEGVTALSQVELDKLIDDKIEQILESILQQIQAQVQQIFMRAGTRCVNTALAPVIEGAKTWLAKGIDSLYAEPQLKQGQEQLKIGVGASLPKLDANSLIHKTGEIITDLANETIDEVITAAGVKDLLQLQDGAIGINLQFTVKDNLVYLLENTFSGDAITSTIVDSLPNVSAGLNIELSFNFQQNSSSLDYDYFNNESMVLPFVGGYIEVDPSLSRSIKGNHGENAAALTLQRAGYGELKSKHASNNGFDGVWVKYKPDGSLADVIITESKYGKSGYGRLNKTETIGKQLSTDWIRANITLLKESRSPELKATGELLEKASKDGILRIKSNVLAPSGTNRWHAERITNFEPNIYTNRPSPILPGSKTLSELPTAANNIVQSNIVSKDLIGGAKKFTPYASTFIDLASTARTIYTQYQQDKLTGNFNKTYQTVASEAGCWAGSLAFAKAGAYAGSFFPGPGTLVGAAIGGATGCYIGSKAAEHSYTKASKDM